MSEVRLSSAAHAWVRHENLGQAATLVGGGAWFLSVGEPVLALACGALAWLVVRTAREKAPGLGEAWATPAGLRFEQPGESRVVPWGSIVGARHRWWTPAPSLFGRVELMIENEIGDAEQVSFAPVLGAWRRGRPAPLVELEERIEAAQLGRIEGGDETVPRLAGPEAD